MTILLFEQNAKLVLKYADHGYVMEARVISFGDRADLLQNDPRV
ncbi:MAG: hypothetical protein ABSA01_05335 [Anaerolineales bacterium]